MFATRPRDLSDPRCSQSAIACIRTGFSHADPESAAFLHLAAATTSLCPHSDCTQFLRDRMWSHNSSEGVREHIRPTLWYCMSLYLVEAIFRPYVLRKPTFLKFLARDDVSTPPKKSILTSALTSIPPLSWARNKEDLHDHHNPGNKSYPTLTITRGR